MQKELGDFHTLDQNLYYARPLNISNIDSIAINCIGLNENTINQLFKFLSELIIVMQNDGEKERYEMCLVSFLSCHIGLIFHFNRT